MLFITLIPRTLQVGIQWPQVLHSLYLAWAKMLFVFGLTLTLLPSILGVKSIVKFMMDTSFFNIIAKISFCIYLVHLTFIQRTIANKKIDFYYTQSNIFVLFSYWMLISIIFGFLLTITVEVPFSKLEKHLIEKLKTKSIEKNINPQEKNKEPTTINLQ